MHTQSLLEFDSSKRHFERVEGVDTPFEASKGHTIQPTSYETIRSISPLVIQGSHYPVSSHIHIEGPYYPGNCIKGPYYPMLIYVRNRCGAVPFPARRWFNQFPCSALEFQLRGGMQVEDISTQLRYTRLNLRSLSRRGGGPRRRSLYLRSL